MISVCRLVGTFGGAYAVLAYVAQAAVESYAWLEPGEMLDGLGMAETTPGPLIMVTQFVGFMGAYRDPGGLTPWLAGVLGGLLILREPLTQGLALGIVVTLCGVGIILWRSRKKATKVSESGPISASASGHIPPHETGRADTPIP